MTPEENLSDLEQHAQDFRDRVGFTYTVLDPVDRDVIGCVYLYPSPLDRGGRAGPVVGAPNPRRPGRTAPASGPRMARRAGLAVRADRLRRRLIRRRRGHPHPVLAWGFEANDHVACR